MSDDTTQQDEAAMSPASVGSVANDWIPVAERLPTDRTVVLAWQGKRVVFGYSRDGQWIDTLYGWVIPNGPSHWMPLPAPPTDGK